MRLRTDVWVSALIRRVHAEGDFAAVERKGAVEAGAIFLKVERRDRSCRLYGPAPQIHFSDDSPGERLFSAIRPETICDPASAQLQLEKEMRFDSDLWIVSIESDEGESYFEIVQLD